MRSNRAGNNEEEEDEEGCFVCVVVCVRGRERENCVREKDCNNALDASYEFTEKPFGFFFDDFLSYDFFTSEFRV